jgi:hypothetical protein
LNFKAVGIDDPSCFDGRITEDQIRLTPLSNETLRAGFRSILNYANKRGIRGDWLNYLEKCLRYHERGLAGRALTHLVYGDFRLLVAKVRRKLPRPSP